MPVRKAQLLVHFIVGLAAVVIVRSTAMHAQQCKSNTMKGSSPRILHDFSLCLSMPPEIKTTRRRDIYETRMSTMFASPHFRGSVLPRHFLTAASFILFNSLRRTSFVAPSIPASIAQGCGIQGRAAWKSIHLASKLLFHPSCGCRQLRGVCDEPEVVFSVQRYILRSHVFRAVLKLVTKSPIQRSHTSTIS